MLQINPELQEKIRKKINIANQKSYRKLKNQQDEISIAKKEKKKIANVENWFLIAQKFFCYF